MVKNYKNSKVYKIVSPHTEYIYIGSTTSRLKNRLSSHVLNYKRGVSYCSSYEILKYGDYDIFLIEKIACDDVEELRRAERCYIEKNKNCVNMKLPARTLKEFKKTDTYKQYLREYNKEYREGQRRRDQIKHERISIHGIKISESENKEDT
jgi:hypothetical protein